MGLSCRNPADKPQESPPLGEKGMPEGGSETEIAASLKKVKENVMECLMKASNAPSSETQIALLDERFSLILPQLHHTPDHPPYAWMIEKALRELNEPGGSSEDSISNFIRKEYNDLPYAHSTMLKYHLDRHCQFGELVLARGQRYLLAAETSESKIRRKCRRKLVKRKKGWGREIMQRKRHRKVNREKSILCGDDKEGSLVIHDEEECSIGGNKEQKPKAEGMTGTVKLSVAENIGANGNSDVPFDKPSSLMIMDGENNVPKLRMQQPTGEPIAGKIDSVSPDARQPEDNRVELATPEKLLGHDSVAFEQSSQFQPETSVSSELPAHPEQLNQNHAPGFSDAQEKCSGPECFLVEESLPTDRAQRYMRRNVRLSGVKTSVPSAEKQDIYPPKPEFCDQDSVHSKGDTSVEHQREKQVTQGNQTSRVLRSQTGKHDQQERQKPEYPIHLQMPPKVKPDTEVLTELTHTIHQTKRDLVLQGPKSELYKGTIGDKLIKHDLEQRQLGLRGRGRGRGQPPDSSMPAKARADGLLVGANDQDLQHPDDSLQAPPEKLNIRMTEKLLLKPVDNHHLDQHLRKPRLRNPTKPKGDADTAVKSSFKCQTRYRGRGRTR